MPAFRRDLIADDAEPPHCHNGTACLCCAITSNQTPPVKRYTNNDGDQLDIGRFLYGRFPRRSPGGGNPILMTPQNECLSEKLFPY